MVLAAMKYNQLSPIMFPGKPATLTQARPVGNPAVAVRVFELPTGAIYPQDLCLTETFNKIYYLLNAAELDADLCSVQNNA